MEAAMSKGADSDFGCDNKTAAKDPEAMACLGIPVIWLCVQLMSSSMQSYPSGSN